jgi:N-acetylmuramoyl-L-alanine amidase
MIKRLDFLVLFVFLTTFFLAFCSSTLPSVLVTPDGKSHPVHTEKIEGIEYVSVNQLSEILNAEIYWHRFLRKVVLDFDDHQLVFTWFSPYMLYDSEVYNLTYEVKPRSGTIYIPLTGFQRILDYIHAPSTSPLSGLAVQEVQILDLRIAQKVNGILVEIFISQPAEYEIFAPQNRDLNVNFYRGKLNVGYFSKKKAPRFVKWIKAFQFDNSAQLSLRLKRPFLTFTHNVKTDPYRIQISLIHSPTSSDTARKYLTYAWSESEKPPDDLIDVVAIDPGHGGEDFGAVGKSGLSEKEVTLDIAKRLVRLLGKEKEVQAILTREADVLVPLQERAQIANRNGADVFISIHTNSFKKRSVRGSETFFLAAAETDEARAAAALENSSIRFEHPHDVGAETDDLDFILMDLIQNEHLKESSDLAATIQRHLGKDLSIPGRGVNQAGFIVLNEAYMPAVLVEVAFISNKKDEKMLKKDSFREKIAQALYESIKEFKRKYESMN